MAFWDSSTNSPGTSTPVRSAIFYPGGNDAADWAAGGGNPQR
jgi:hypothetical protein